MVPRASIRYVESGDATNGEPDRQQWQFASEEVFWDEKRSGGQPGEEVLYIENPVFLYGGDMTVTTIDIDPEILRELKDAYGIKTSKDAVNFALHEAVMRKRQLAAVDAIAALDLEVSPQKIEYAVD